MTDVALIAELWARTERAKRAYYAQPIACSAWCRTCIRPIARANRCAACNETLRLRARDRRTKP